MQVGVRAASGPEIIHLSLLTNGNNLSFVLIKTLSSMKTNKLCKQSPLPTSAARSGKCECRQSDEGIESEMMPQKSQPVCLCLETHTDLVVVHYDGDLWNGYLSAQTKMAKPIYQDAFWHQHAY